MLEEKSAYTIQDLFDNLDISILELSRVSKINEVTLARIRDGKPTRRSTANKLLNKFSEIYKRPFNLRNVTGINVQVNKRLEAKNAHSVSKQDSDEAA
jgi:predicted transcriptional regulator